MSSTVEQYQASIERLNAIAAEGRIDSIFLARESRLELKTTMRLARQLIAEDADPEVRQLRQRQLHFLKRMHWNLIQVEAISIILAAREN